MYGIKWVNNNVNGDGNFQIASITTPSGSPHDFIGANGTTALRLYMDGGNRFARSPTNVGDEITFVLRVTKPASNYLCDCWVDGVKQTQYDAGTSLTAAGGYMSLMVGYNGYSDMDMYEFIMAEGTYDDDDAQALADYLHVFPATVPTVVTDPTDISGLHLWLDAADRGVTTNQWDDKSGNANHATSASAGEFPTFADGEAAFDGSDDHLDLADMSSLTSGEMFLVIKIANDPPASPQSGLMKIGTALNNDHYPWVDNNIVVDFGSTVRKFVGNWAGDMTKYHVLNIQSETGGWVTRFNGITEYSTAVNTVGFSSSPTLGVSYDALTNLEGSIIAMVVYDHVLTDEDRAGVEAYMQTLITYDPTSVASLELWLDANDRGTTTDQWDDKSGNANHFTSASGQFPTFTAGEAIFSTGDFLTGPNFSALTEGHIFLAVENDVESGGAQGTPMDFDQTSSIDHYAYVGGTVYNGFGSTVRKTCGNPAQALVDPHILSIHTAANDWEMKIDGVSIYSTTSNTVSFHTAPWLGKSGYAWDGRIKAVLFYNAKLSVDDEADVMAYLATLQTRLAIPVCGNIYKLSRM